MKSQHEYTWKLLISYFSWSILTILSFFCVVV
jgi:hypothetical protein